MQLIDDYNSLHQCPEPDRQLIKTLAYVKSRLAGLSCTLFSPAESALAAFFDFGKGETLAFRADMDAVMLPQGAVHACGHDGHTAILLAFAQWLHTKPETAYNVLLLFQPAEETNGGARDICQSGVLTQYRVCGVFGLHLWPGLAAGEVFSKSGVLMGYATQISVRFSGVSCHIAQPKRGKDALAAACRFYNRVESLHLGKGCLLKFGMLHGGTAPNVICGQAELSGSLRYIQAKTGSRLMRQLMGICKRAAYFTGCRGDIHFSEGYPAVENHARLFQRIQDCYPVHTLQEPLMTADDFSCYQQAVPGVYFLLGVGNVPPLHSPDFSFDPFVLTKGVALFQAICQKVRGL